MTLGGIGIGSGEELLCCGRIELAVSWALMIIGSWMLRWRRVVLRKSRSASGTRLLVEMEGLS
jgi:hypothetical protein